MSIKVRYILGAGASFGSVPLVSEMPQRVLEYGLTFKYASEFFLANSTPNSDLWQKAEMIQKWAGYLLELSGSLKNAFSFHTKAKFLYAKGSKGEKDYDKLKKAIALIIISEQLVRPHNNRYDAFLAALAVHSRKFNELENIEILNWNYDFQFWLSAQQIDQKIQLSDLEKKLNHVYLNGYTSCEARFNDLIFADFDQHKEFIEWVQKQNISEQNMLAIKNLSSIAFTLWEGDLLNEIEKDASKKLKFSWEVSFLDILNRIDANDPENTVIIGYSLPTFNRQMDNQLFASYTSPSTKPKKVYVQCDKGNSEVVSKLRGMGFQSYHQIIPVKNSREFFIPPEYNFNRLPS
jgi:hypothetical protein